MVVALPPNSLNANVQLQFSRGISYVRSQRAWRLDRYHSGA